MKLIKRTYLLAAFWLLPVLVLGSVFSFFVIQYINIEETDEFLTYEMERLQKYHKENYLLPEYHKVADILQDTYYPTPIFKDTMMLEPGDNELVPHRELHFSINHKGRDFGIVLRHLMPGKDDIAEGALLIVSGLMVLVILVLWLSISFANKLLWKDFYHTLQKLVHFRITQPIPQLPDSNIHEFRVLNETVRTWLKKVSDDYHHNKEFNENVSHELQTQLAVIRTHTEKLLNEAHEGDRRLQDLQRIYEASNSLTRFQKSLLLLSKINNLEFSNKERVNLAETVIATLKIYEDAIGVREVRLDSELHPLEVKMDRGLAEIMIGNLIKNAVKHNVQKGFINIQLTENALIIENSGAILTEKPEMLIDRFRKGSSGGHGIGLAIVKQVCDINHFELSYELTGGRHRISIKV